MRAATRTSGQALGRVWDALPRLIALNVLWLVISWPLLTLGAATLAAYAWLRRAVLEHEALRAERLARGEANPPVPLAEVFSELRRLWWPGSLWWLATLAFGFVVWANLALWSSLLAPFGRALVTAALGYVVWLWLALQPYWLDALAEGERPRAAFVEALRIVVRYPLFAHLCALPPLALVVLGSWLRTFWPLVGVSVLLLYWAHVATADPRSRGRESAEGLL